MRKVKYSDSFIREIKRQKETKTISEIAKEHNQRDTQVCYILYSAKRDKETPKIPEFLLEEKKLEVHADDKKFFENYRPRAIDKEKKKRSFLDWLLGR